MPPFTPAAITGLSCVLRFRCVIVVCLLFLFTASAAAAQTITANGTNGAISIYRGDRVAITASGTGHTRDWVGLYLVGSPSGYPYYRDWYYLNGTKSIPSSAVGSAAFQFPVIDNPGNYEFRLHRGENYAVIGTAGVVTLQPLTMNINGIVAPQTVSSAPGATIQINVFGGTGNWQDWVGIYRIGAADTAWSDWVRLNGTRETTGAALHSASFPMTMPIPRGPYEVRWFGGASYTRMATSTIITSEVSTVAAGGDGHTLMVRAGGTSWSAGQNAFAQLGDGSTTDRPAPAQIAGLNNIVSVAAGAAHSLAITASGVIHAWGANDAGQIGDDTTTQRTTPTQLALSNVVAVAAGEQHSVALTSTGDLYTWGLNASGQLGNGTTTNSDVPIHVASGVMAIGAGDHFTLFVKADGRVWGMGDNEFGALGDGTSTTRTLPVQMSAVANAIAVQGGAKHSLILLANGTVYATGRNNLGQVGDGSLVRWTPVALGLSNIVGIAAGDEFSLALEKSGAVWSWGNNASGQLGVETPSVRTAPATVPGLSGITYIAAGNAFSIAMNTTGVVTSFGANGAGQLGDGTTTDRLTPTISEGFSERLAAPTFTVAPGTYTTTFSVLVNHAITGITLRYTQNGSDPTESDPTIAPGGSVSIEHSQTLKVKAWKTGWLPSTVGAAAYEMKATEPSFSPAAGTFSSPTSVTLSTGTAGAIVRYTVDGSTPTLASPQYAGPIAVNTATTLRAAAFKTNWSASNVSEAAYAMNFGTVGSPTVEPATGTYVGGTTVTMSTGHSGAVVRFTTNGDSPTTDSAIYTSPIPVDGTMTVKAKAFHRDYTASAETSRIYTIAAAPPTITPSTGTYTTAQTVEISPSAGPASTVRYTLDGSEPTETSILYTAAISIDTLTTVKARSFPNDGSPGSALATAALSFNYGSLAPPISSPAAGVYANAQLITLSAFAGAVIRYTTDGSDPTSQSTVYTAPIPINSGMVAIRGRAFHQDWMASPASTAAYTIDTTAPVIVGKVWPSPNAAGWNNTAVTVSFECSDNVGIASCPLPILVSGDGSGQLIQGVASDIAGNSTSTSVTVSVDTAPPNATLTGPTNLSSTTQSTVTASGTATDNLSGLTEIGCNGVLVPVGATFECDVALRPGRNSVVVHATDAAGNTTSSGTYVTRSGPKTLLSLTPTMSTLLLNSTSTLALLDDFGSEVTGATWSTSDATVIELSTDDPPLVTAVGVGSATITVSAGGFTTTATVLVPSSASFVTGTERWRVTTAGAGASMAPPIIPRITSINAPDMFLVERLPDGTALLRATTISGRQMWTAFAPGVPLIGDSFGGVIVGVEDTDFYRALVRVAGPASALPWRYDSPGQIEAPSQGRDGTLYAIEWIRGVSWQGQEFWDKHLVAINGSTGRLIARRPIGRDRLFFDAALDGVTLSNNITCQSRRDEFSPQTTGPVVGNDGRGYLLVRRWMTHGSGSCLGFPITKAETRTSEVAIELVALSSSGAESTSTLHSQTCTAEANVKTLCDHPGTVEQLMPDGAKGLLTHWSKTSSFSPDYILQHHLTRIDSDQNQVVRAIPDNTSFLMTDSSRTVVLVSNFAFEARDVITWASVWNAPAIPGAGPLFTNPVGATFFEPAAQRLHIVENGVVTRTETINSSNGHYYRGAWFSTTAGALANIVVAEPMADSTRYSGGVGNEQTSRAPRIPCGLCQKDYKAPQGKGPVSANDRRRILTVAFDASWNESPGQTNVHLWNMTERAMQRWNDAMDGYRNKNWAYFMFHNSNHVGEPDVVIRDGVCDASIGGGWACIEIDLVNGMEDHSQQSIITIPRHNLTTATVRDEDLIGRVAHELAHKLGAHGTGECYFDQSILRGSNKDGTRDQNGVYPADVELVNFALNHPNSCTGFGNEGFSEPLEQLATLGAVAMPWDVASVSPTTPQVQMASGAPMVLLVLALLLVGCTGSQIQPSQETNSYFEELATAAKARGESEVKISNRSGPLHAQSLENVLADASVVVATAEPNSTTGAADRRIMTWQQFSVDQWLVRQAPDDSPMCNVTKPPQSPPEGKIVIGLAKGSVNIGGVSITDVSDGDLNFNEKQRYLMFGLQCPNGRFIIPWGTTGIYQVSPEGSILTTSLNEDSAFSREVRRFATIASLAEEVRKMKQLKRER